MKKFILFLFALCSTGFACAEEALAQATMYARPEGGFVMVDDATGELIGFSEKGTVSALSEDVKRMFADFGREVRISTEAIPAEVADMLALEVTDSVGPLLGDIQFGQGDPFRANTPLHKNQHCVAGCVAIAMAQIMTYYRYPKTPCHGSVSYKTSTLNFTVSLDLEGHVFDWDNILPNYKNGYNKAQAAAVADLVFACGATAHMDYTLDGSGTNTDWALNALISHFDYDHSIENVARADQTDAEWHRILQAEIKAKRPMLMRSNPDTGAGHAYVLDGYYIQKGYENYPYYHFNWGWEGSEDGWFLLNNLKAGPYDLRFNQQIIRNIMPKGQTPVDEVEADASDNMNIYDLLGRRVDSPLSGHIYIRNGKKFLAQ